MLEVLSIAIGKGLNVHRSANVSGEKEYNESFQDVYFLRIRQRNF